MRFGHWLRYNSFPCFNVPDGVGGGGAPEPQNDLSSVKETQSEIGETEAFALEAFEQNMRDDDGDEGPVEQEAPEPKPQEEIPAAKPVSEPARAPAQTPGTPKPGDATPPKVLAEGQTATQQGALEPVAPQQTQVATQSAPDEKTLAGLADVLNQQQDVFVKALAQQRYRFSPEQLERLNGPESGEVIAEIAAKVQVETTGAMMRVLWNTLPAFIAQVVQKNVSDESAETSFWNANTGLDRAKHKELVANAGALFRKSFPQADQAAFNKNVGNMVLGMLGQVAQATALGANGAAQPQVRTPGTVVRQVSPGYVPAGAHAAPASSAPKPQMNEWEKMLDLNIRDNNGEFE